MARAATVHHRQVADPLMARYPNLAVCGGAFAAPSGPYGVSELERFIRGYKEWPWPDNNVSHMRVLSVHSYGYKGKRAAADGLPPTAPDLGQSSLNSYFYPVYDRPGEVSGYRAGVDKVREILDRAGGTAVKLANTEWWAMGQKKLDPESGARTALGDLAGVVLHCRNAASWQFDSLSFHAANVAPWEKDLSAWRGPHDCLVGVVSGALYRTARYACLKDMAGYFLGRYKRLVEADVATPDNGGGNNRNPVGRIQACSGLAGAGELGVLIMNTDLQTSETARVAWAPPAKGPVAVRRLPSQLPVETPIPRSQVDQFDDPARTRLTVALGPGEAVLLEIAY